MTKVVVNESEYKKLSSQRYEKAVEMAVSLLLNNISSWKDEVDAYWLLRSKEDLLDYPVTYEIVEEAIERVKRIIRQEALQEEKALT